MTGFDNRREVYFIPYLGQGGVMLMLMGMHMELLLSPFFFEVFLYPTPFLYTILSLQHISVPGSILVNFFFEYNLRYFFEC